MNRARRAAAGRGEDDPKQRLRGGLERVNHARRAAAGHGEDDPIRRLRGFPARETCGRRHSPTPAPETTHGSPEGQRTTTQRRRRVERRRIKRRRGCTRQFHGTLGQEGGEAEEGDALGQEGDDMMGGGGDTPVPVCSGRGGGAT